MKFVFYTNSVSPHQLPLARELVKILGKDNYRYVYTQKLPQDRKGMGWPEESASWIVCEAEKPIECRQLLVNCDILMSGIRDMGLFEARLGECKKTIYCSERWFKPRLGLWRLLVPSYFTMARRFVRLFNSTNNMFYYPTGLYAAKDMARLCGLMRGDITCLLKSPRLDFEQKPCGKILLESRAQSSGKARCCGLEKMAMWGYFVESSTTQFPDNFIEKTDRHNAISHSLRVLWVGRMLRWKKVDTIIEAIKYYRKWNEFRKDAVRISLTLVGDGPERIRLKESIKSTDVVFLPPQPISKIRELMRQHDVYVLASDGTEGWGAALNEALEEGMVVLGTHEAGSSRTILPTERQFRAGDSLALAKLLDKAAQGYFRPTGIGVWSVSSAAQKLVEFAC